MPAKVRWSPTLGPLEASHQEVWGTEEYDPDKHRKEPCVFFGLYGLPDFYALWRHKGKKYVLWAGTDIIHFENGYFLDHEGDIRLDKKSLARWLNKNCENWCENNTEKLRLFLSGIEANVCPSFLGDVSKYELSYEVSDRPRVYSSVSGDEFEKYGWFKILDLATQHKDIEFHLYGNKKPFPVGLNNVVVHGRVSKEKMNEEIMHMQGGLRMVDFDGFSEVLAKSILWGQWPISEIKYPNILSPDQLDELKNKTEPNIEGRNYYLKKLNQFPWVR